MPGHFHSNGYRCSQKDAGIGGDAEMINNYVDVPRSSLLIWNKLADGFPKRSGDYILISRTGIIRSSHFSIKYQMFNCEDKFTEHDAAECGDNSYWLWAEFPHNLMSSCMRHWNSELEKMRK